jgi:hypothetical protein
MNKQGKTEGAVFVETGLAQNISNCIYWNVDPYYFPAAPYVVPTLKSQEFRSKLKKPVDDTRFLDVRMTDMWIDWVRNDGGRTAPKRYHFTYDVYLPAGGTATLNNAPMMTPEMMVEAPFDSLRIENGGVDPETNNREISLVAKITWYGYVYNGDQVKGSYEVGEYFYPGSGCNNNE